MGASGNGCPFLFFAPLASTIIVLMGVLREGASAKIASPSAKKVPMPTKFTSPSTEFVPMGDLREGASTKIASASAKKVPMPTRFASPSTKLVPMGDLREGASAKIASASTKKVPMPTKFASPSTQFWSLFNKLRQVKDAGHGGWLLFEGLYKKVPPTSGRRNL